LGNVGIVINIYFELLDSYYLISDIFIINLIILEYIYY